MLVQLHKSIAQKALIGSKIYLVMYVDGHNCRENGIQVLILSGFFCLRRKKSLRWVIIHVVYTAVTCLHVD